MNDMINRYKLYDNIEEFMNGYFLYGFTEKVKRKPSFTGQNACCEFIDCGQLGMMHAISDEVVRHMQFATDINGRYMCPNCSSTYKQKGHLVRHIKYECGVDPQFICQICFRKFKHKSNLKAHYVILHKTVEVFEKPPLKLKFDRLSLPLNIKLGNCTEKNDSP
ncbi:hypothetical protein JTB14_033831 [Gonioctena quinquepunctata]|nr:hypothetical protein JTB14_033831 [Gonioctena quinquepunctata]